jgi:hypothetical protein
VRLPACKNIELQAAYPSQADGGFAGDLHNSLRVALDRWEKRRGHNDFRYGRGGTGVFRREKAATATRSEISWNKAPEIKRASGKETIRITQTLGAGDTKTSEHKITRKTKTKRRKTKTICSKK